MLPLHTWTYRSIIDNQPCQFCFIINNSYSVRCYLYIPEHIGPSQSCQFCFIINNSYSVRCYLYIPEHIGPSLITSPVSSVLLSTIVTPLRQMLPLHTWTYRSIIDNQGCQFCFIINNSYSVRCYLYIPEHIGPSLITSPVSSVLLSTIVTPSDVTFTYRSIIDCQFCFIINLVPLSDVTFTYLNI